MFHKFSFDITFGQKILKMRRKQLLTNTWIWDQVNVCKVCVRKVNKYYRNIYLSGSESSRVESLGNSDYLNFEVQFK